jgi:hypothetical protein
VKIDIEAIKGKLKETLASLQMPAPRVHVEMDPTDPNVLLVTAQIQPVHPVTVDLTKVQIKGGFIAMDEHVKTFLQVLVGPPGERIVNESGQLGVTL